MGKGEVYFFSQVLKYRDFIPNTPESKEEISLTLNYNY